MANPVANHGSASVLYVTASGGANLGTDLTQYVTSIQPSYTEARVDTTTLGNTSRRSIGGFRENGFEVAGVWDTTLDAVLMGLLNASTAAPFTYYPAGTAAGKTRHDGTAFCHAYAPPTDTESAVTWTASFGVEGDVSRTTIA